MNYLVVGAGNASRPVARLLNYLGHDVTVTDLKDKSEFRKGDGLWDLQQKLELTLVRLMYWFI